MQGADVATDEKPYERTSETIIEERETVSHCVSSECGPNGDKTTPKTRLYNNTTFRNVSRLLTQMLGSNILNVKSKVFV